MLDGIVIAAFAGDSDRHHLFIIDFAPFRDIAPNLCAIQRKGGGGEG